jgi:PHD/YefM family antitoxin component YafN of YafNO toxin-antitoxin module
MAIHVSKSEFRARALELLRQVETTGDRVVITDRGAPKVEVRRYVAPEHEAEHAL